VDQASTTEIDFIVLTPPGRPEAALAIAASRWGALGILNLEFQSGSPAALSELDRLAGLGRGRYGALLADPDDELLDEVLRRSPAAVLVAAGDTQRLPAQLERIHTAGASGYVVVTHQQGAEAAAAAGADALIAKGHEAGGWVGDETAFVLFQRLIRVARVPVWVHGGIGLHTAAACRAGGAAGLVLDSQLLLTRESPLPEALRARLAATDGSETVCLGTAVEAPFRLFSRPDLRPAQEAQALDAELTVSDVSLEQRQRRWRELLHQRVGWEDPESEILAIGQDVALAGDLAQRFRTVGGVLTALQDSARQHCEMAKDLRILAEGGPLAGAHGTRYPVAQGPMTRVSDRAQFARAVAEAGALPFLALALMRAPDVKALLEETRDLLGEKPWGVGILGFVPPELRAEQMEGILACPPTFALIAGGRPDQARSLEHRGIPTYLHVPSPGLLEMFLKDGARRFVFEGRECGGHTGPRTSFVLWESMIRVLLDAIAAGTDGSEFHVLFAGGINDGLSAAMVSAMAAPLAEQGVRIGVLMGTAYLFTQEAVEAGAITPGFQAAALACDRTVLLESGPGQTTRCAPSPYVAEFQERRKELMLRGLPPEDLKNELEILNIGRLRIASKGIDHNPLFGSDPAADRLLALDEEQQRQRGMYMIGQVAALRDRVCSLEELHREVCGGATERLQSVLEVTVAEPSPPPAEVAIVGMGCILPGAPELKAYWNNILNKVDAITEVPETRWDWRLYYDPDRSAPDKTHSRWGGFISDVPFDPLEFGMPPSSLRSIEPFQLLTLLTVQAALRDAGYLGRPFPRERASVVLGAGGGGGDLTCGYITRTSLPSLFGERAPELTGQLKDHLPEWTEDSFAGLLMNVAAGRAANRLDLGGANFTVDAACASSLAAVYLGVRELESHATDVAIVGGLDALENPFTFLCFSKTQAHSPTGRCRTFDAQADGIAISEGFGAVVLKRLADAERDGDRIYAVIRGVGSSSDGRDRSLTAPRAEGQVRALHRAYSQARVSPASVGLVEAHGTGTVAGDQTEVEALTSYFGAAGAERQGCAIGSVKSMIGHTKAAAGVAGLIKIALALYHRVLPPTLGVSEPNPKANFPASPFYVNTETRPWIHTGPEPRRAAASSFGFGGTNFHILAEEYSGAYLPQSDAVVDPWPAELFLWRGTRQEVQESIDKLARQLETGAQLALADLACSISLPAARGEAGSANLAIAASSLEDLQEKLRLARDILQSGRAREHLAQGVHFSGEPFAKQGQLAFLFPGQGSQYVNMLRDLVVAFPQARALFERADRVLEGAFDQPLSRYVFPIPVFSPDEERAQQAALTETNVAQPALGASDLALLEVLGQFGVRPDMTAGHSYGEFVALCAAGCFEPETLFLLSEARGRFMKEGAGADSGVMAAVDAAAEPLQELADACGVTLANFNAPRQTVISGSRSAVDQAMAWCHERGIRAQLLPVACAFHSPLVAPAQKRLAELLRQSPIRVPRIPVFSNATATAYPGDPSEIAGLLGSHLTQPVQFVREIEAMHEAGARIFVEAGPRGTLSALTQRILADREHLCVALDQAGRPGLVQLQHGLAMLASEGVRLNLEPLFRGRAVRKLDLNALGQDGAGSRVSPTTWLVNGGGARPASEPPRKREPIPLQLGTAGSQPLPVTGPSPRRNGQHPQPPLPSAAAEPPKSEIIDQFQQVMQQFLQTQRSVMLSYLGGTAGPHAGVPAAPAATAPASSMPDEPEPPHVPVLSSSIEDAPAHAPAAAALTADALMGRLLQLVSERTGYPTDMLGLDADLEADLGIDSIKRVEIAGTLVQSLAIPAEKLPEMEKLTACRSLRQILNLLEGNVVSPTVEVVEDTPPDRSEPSPEVTDEEAAGEIGRFALLPVRAVPAVADAGLARDGTVVIVDDAADVGRSLAEILGHRGYRTLLASTEALDPGTSDAVEAFIQSLRIEGRPVSGLVYLNGLRPAPAPQIEVELWSSRLSRDVTILFRLAQALEPDLQAAAMQGGAAILAATAFGGDFGIESASDGFWPGSAALTGFVKTLALEWPAVRVKAIDLGAAEAHDTAAWLADELLTGDGVVEVGYRRGQRVRLELIPAELPGQPGIPPLDGSSVVLVTGGARGITAEAALRLAERYHPILVLAGRTVLSPDPEPASIAGLVNPAEVKAALIEEQRRLGKMPSPAEIEASCRWLMQQRELRDNLARLQTTGAQIEYLSCDVSDAVSFTNLIDDVYRRHGRIDGVIHGAGVIEDKLVHDKALDSFRRVLHTKVDSALTLARVLDPERLKFLVFFSSISGRFGNRGQGDYAAASEVLNKLAQYLDRRWPGRVVSINWGPWLKTGMVSDGVRRQFAERGVSLIPVDVGCRKLDAELCLGRKGEVEVLIGGAGRTGGEPVIAAKQYDTSDQPLLSTATVVACDATRVELVRRFDVSHDRYLADHQLDGRPVVPFAMALELVAEVVAAGWPDLQVAQVQQRLMSGIVLDGEPRDVRAVAELKGRANDAAEVDVRLYGDLDSRRPHYRAVVRLAPRLDRASPRAVELDGNQAKLFPLTVEQAYNQWLFHGPVFQGIQSIDWLSEEGARAVLAASGPSVCLNGNAAGSWLIDPVLVDCGFQMQVIWARHHWDVTLLPSGLQSCRRFPALAELRPADEVRYVLDIRQETSAPSCRANHYFYDRHGRPLLCIEDAEGTGSPALNRLGGQHQLARVGD